MYRYILLLVGFQKIAVRQIILSVDLHYNVLEQTDNSIQYDSAFAFFLLSPFENEVYGLEW